MGKVEDFRKQRLGIRLLHHIVMLGLRYRISVFRDLEN